MSKATLNTIRNVGYSILAGAALFGLAKGLYNLTGSDTVFNIIFISGLIIVALIITGIWRRIKNLLK